MMIKQKDFRYNGKYGLRLNRLLLAWRNAKSEQAQSRNYNKMQHLIQFKKLQYHSHPEWE